MKKNTLVLIGIIVATFSTQAQTTSKKIKNEKVHYGLRSGYEFQANKSNLKYKLNLPYLGVYSDIRLNEKLSLQIELNLRSEKRVGQFNDGTKITIDELYLTVPVLLKYPVNNKFNIYAGTQVLSASFVSNVFGIKKWNGILGVEYNFIKNLFIDARFRHGFEEKDFNNSMRDNRVSLGINYKF